MKTKVIAVTNADGDVVSTHEVLEALPDGSPPARIVPVAGQSIHELTIERPQRFEKAEDVDKFHASLRRHVGKAGR